MGSADLRQNTHQNNADLCVYEQAGQGQPHLLALDQRILQLGTLLQVASLGITQLAQPRLHKKATAER